MIASWIARTPRMYATLTAEARAGRADLALLALRHVDRMLDMDLVRSAWRAVPVGAVRDDVLAALIGTGCGRDFRIVYTLRLVADARALHLRARKRELLCVAMLRAGGDSVLARVDSVVARMLLELAEL